MTALCDVFRFPTRVEMVLTATLRTGWDPVRLMLTKPNVLYSCVD